MSNGIVKEDYQEGVWESEYKCKKCRRNAVVGYKPYRDNPWLIWYDCMYCGAELGDGEEPNSHIPKWFDPREKQKELEEAKRDKELKILKEKAKKYDELMKILKGEQ